MKRPPIRILDLKGSPEEIGHQHGTTYADEIKIYTRERIHLASGQFWAGQEINESEKNLALQHTRIHAPLQSQ